MVAWRSTGSAHTGFGVLTTNGSYQGNISFGRMPTMFAGTAVARTGVLNVSFVCFCPETCLSGHDDIADMSNYSYFEIDVAHSPHPARHAHRA